MYHEESKIVPITDAMELRLEIIDIPEEPMHPSEGLNIQMKEFAVSVTHMIESSRTTISSHLKEAKYFRRIITLLIKSIQNANCFIKS